MLKETRQTRQIIEKNFDKDKSLYFSLNMASLAVAIVVAMKTRPIRPTMRPHDD